MQTPAADITLVVVVLVGTVMMFLLVLFILLTLILHQKRMLTHQLQLGRLKADKQQDLLRVTLSAQEEERRRLAAELHDSVGQVLSAIKLNLHRMEENMPPDGAGTHRTAVLRTTQLLAEECVQEIRRIIYDVYPPLLADFGLTAALEDLCGKLHSGSLQVHCTLSVPDLSLPLSAQVSLYRVVQELFSNTIRHAAASHVWVSLEQTGGLLQLTFRDNGAGFDAESVMQHGKGLGLRNLRNRVELLQGRLSLTSRPGAGTLVVILLDLPPVTQAAPPS